MEENVGLRGVASGSRSHELGLVGGDSSENSSSTDRREDCNIELQLGKRGFYGVGVKSSSASDSSSQSQSQSQSQSKKSRGGSASAPASPAPRCQVEGCREELTSAKDYHKRHKVCEAHSKTPQVRVNGINQRFCQQCSRFHELKEFDEGKRSCRRRLKGHNERRRKPQPYPTGLSSGRLPLPFHDNRYGSLFNDRPFLFHPSFGQTSVLQCLGEYKQDNCKRAWSRSLKSGDILTYESLNHQSFDQQPYATPGKLLTFLPGSKSSYCNVNNQDYPQYIQSSESPVVEALSLSSPSGPVITGPIVTCSFQGLAGAANSSRALSLLSSQSWASRTSVSDSLNMATQAGIAIDQIMPDHQPHMDQTLIQQGLQPNYGLVEDKLLALNQQSLVSTEFSANEGTSVGKGQNNAGFLASNSGMEPYEIRMPGLFQVPGISCHADASAQDVRCTINLMCRPSNTQTSESHMDAGGGQHGNIPFSVCESGRTYESSMFYPQHMM